jgi:hypothetical protein
LAGKSSTKQCQNLNPKVSGLDIRQEKNF